MDALNLRQERVARNLDIFHRPYALASYQYKVQRKVWTAMTLSDEAVAN